MGGEYGVRGDIALTGLLSDGGLLCLQMFSITFKRFVQSGCRARQWHRWVSGDA